MTKELNCIGCGKSGCDGKTGCDWYDRKAENRDKAIETIRAACIKANPEIEHLKFGCEVRYRDEVWRITSVSGDEGEWDRFVCQRQAYRDRIADQLTVMHEDADFDIIGRPIRLADVLLAIAQCPPQMRFFLLRNNDDAVLSMRLEASMQVVFWNLRQDDLTEQTDECITFLAELLK